jgi:TIR domain
MIFISHREADQGLAESLVEFLISSLEISDDRIRCTSVPGFQLPFGKTISDQLKADISEADAVFVIATPESLNSKWVLFELGASWALSKIVVPILAPGLTEKELPGPLSEYPLVKVAARDAASRMRDAIRQVSEKLEIREKTGGRGQEKLEAFIEGFRWKLPPPPGDGEFVVDFPKNGQVVRDEDSPLRVEGRYSGGPRDIWVILEDSFRQYYVQNPPVRFQPDGSWRATNVLPGRGITFVLFVEIAIANNDSKTIFDQMVQRKQFGAFTELPPGSRVLESVAITRI